MSYCPECQADGDDVIVYSCETCGNYACNKCSEPIPHCPGCTCSMTEVEG